MRYSAYIMVLFFSSISYSQGEPNAGKIRIDSSFVDFFNCITPRSYFDSSEFGVEKICHSKNKIEIRLDCDYMPLGHIELIILCFNGEWNAEKYTLKRSRFGYKIEHTFYKPRPHDSTLNSDFFSSLFDTLKNNNIFLLPDQSELKNSLTIDDGTDYIISYKVADSFRSYHYNNPESYLERFKKVVEYQQLKVIITELKKIFQ